MLLADDHPALAGEYSMVGSVRDGYELVAEAKRLHLMYRDGQRLALALFQPLILEFAAYLDRCLTVAPGHEGQGHHCTYPNHRQQHDLANNHRFAHQVSKRSLLR